MIQSPRPVWWKVILGLVLIIVEIHSHVSPAANLLKASNHTQQVGMDVTALLIVLLGCWLVYSGTKPVWRKSP